MSLFDEDLFLKGLEQRKATLGAAYVEQNLATADDFTRPFQQAMTAWCWGFGWGDEAIDAKTRSMMNLAMIGALGRRGDVMRFLRPVMRDTALREAADTALDQVGLSEFRALRTADLSHGQRRQLELAVALTLNPRAFVMDEPMAGLGAEGSKRLITFLSDLRARTPILLVEHDMDAVFALADRISVLVGGRIIATGPVSEIRANPEVRRAYLGQEDVQP